ncbi:MAG TPA: MBL fold metallo-hydrolase [Anaerolineales bacterium]|nr:MBL fold metallo-hydrolase [Anaerolineales bacterium]
MSKVILLGSSNAVATENHENTHMVIVGGDRAVMVDCVSSPLLRLEKAGVDFQKVTDLIVTHFHPDHVSGLPLMLMGMWLLGRRHPLTVHGLQHALERIERLMDMHGWSTWPAFFPVTFRQLPDREMTPVLNCEDFAILSSPVRHLIPTIGLRIEFRQSGKTVAYSCDTEPCEEVARLAAGADVLIHEAAGNGRGHSSAAQAGEIARQAEVGRLLLIHYPTGKHASPDAVAQASERFAGEVALAQDYMQLEMG